MTELLKGRNAVVTGAGRGIGKAIALALAGEGANVVVNDFGVALDGIGPSKAPADKTVATIAKMGGRAVPNYDSVTEYESAGSIIKDCIDNFGIIDILVNIAGVVRRQLCFDITPEDWDIVVRTHLYGTFFCSQHACIYMKEQMKGRIISATSDAYRGGGPAGVHYSAAKGGIVSLMRSMALELAPYGITCNSIAPGAATRMMVSEESKQQIEKAMKNGIITKDTYNEVMQEIPGPEYVAPLVLYLASDYGAGISGAVLGASGGKISVHTVAQEARTIYKNREDGPWTIEEMKRLIPKTIEQYCPPLESPPLDHG